MKSVRRDVATRVVVSALLLIGVAGACQGQSLLSLAPRADVIVVGTAFARTDSGKVITFSLSIEQSLKGTLKAGTVWPVQWQSLWANSQTYGATSWRGIWFLTQTKSSVLQVIPVRMGVKAFFSELFYQLSPQPAPAELASDVGTSLVDAIVLQLANSAMYDGSDQVLQAAASSESGNITRAFRFLAGRSGARQQAIGLAGLIMGNDISALVQFEAGSAAMSAADLKFPAAAIGVWFRSPDDTAIAALGRLVKSGSEAVRDAATLSLRSIHTAATVPILVSLLDDQSASRRAGAVNGLASFANGFGIQTPSNLASMAYMNTAAPSPYRTADTEKSVGVSPDSGGASMSADTDLQSAVTFWKAWWQQHQSEFQH